MNLKTAALLLGALGFAACDSGEPSIAASSAAEAPALTAAMPVAGPAQAAPRKPDVVFVPTPSEVVTGMLQMARVGPRDTVFDLGCGDGRIVVAAARQFGARAVGVDIDPERVREARARARRAGVEERVEIRQGDLFEADLSGATVVALYLLPALNLKLRPKLLRELRPGTRIVSQSFHMGDWKPTTHRKIGGKDVYLWIVPEPK